jgi:CheY-like chemotaxis protein/nitrogen-specific signal transduction histidine kinase
MTAELLVVDDNPINLKLAGEVLEAAGYSVARAVSAEAALAAIARKPPELILLDLALPDMDGLTLARKLKSDPATRAIKIVALTAFAMKGDEQKARAAGCDGYISKPIDTRALPAQVGDHLHGRSSRPPQCVLIVEDVARNRKLLRVTLEAEGYHVLEAQDGVEALAVLERAPVDAVITDILMPNMDGYRLCYEIRSSDRWHKLPLIIYTNTYVAPGDEQVALDLGADCYLRKPSPVRAIADALHDAARRAATRLQARIEPPRDLELLKSYSGRLVAKLEERNAELLAQTEALRESHKRMADDLAERARAEQARESLEQQLRQAQKLEALGTLAGGIAHDFNNILTAILVNAQIARGRLPEDHPAQENADEIIHASQRAVDLVRQILSFSRRTEPARKPVQLGEVTREVGRLLRASLPAAIDIQVQLAPETPAVMADVSQVHQVLMNLGSNASHAMPNGGRLTITQSVVHVDATLVAGHPELREGRYVRLTVVDTGHGMDAAILERIFEPFFTTKEPGSGTGLGLAVVQGIMRSHEGAILVESQPGVGTKFDLYFPALQDVTTGPRASRPALPRGQGERVLFIDDEPAIVALAIHGLEGLGYRVAAFTKAEEALTELAKQPQGFDLVVTDLSMPGMSGLDVVSRVRALRADVPVMLSTGYNKDLEPARARELGIREVLLKPYSIEVLAQAVRRALTEP